MVDLAMIQTPSVLPTVTIGVVVVVVVVIA
jgi:hypothetical protein